MSRLLSLLCVIALVVLMGAVVICTPSWLSDANGFLKSFVGEPFLNILGVILTITLASLAQLHLSLNRTEERRGQSFLNESRAEIRDAARWLIGLFIVAGLTVVAKPVVVDAVECAAQARAQAIANSFAILIIALYVLILIDVTYAVFDLEPQFDKDSKSGKDGG